MNHTDILVKIAQVHNSIAGIPVSGDNAILMAKALIVLRELVDELQKTDELQKEDSGAAESGK